MENEQNENVGLDYIKHTYKIALSNEDLIERYKLNRIKKNKNDFDEDLKIIKEQLNKINSSEKEKSSSILKIIQDKKLNKIDDNSYIYIDRSLIEKGFSILS